MDRTDKQKKLRHDRHTVSLLTDHLVFSPKYRGKIFVGDVAICKEIKRKVEQNTERGISASQGLVRRSSLGTELLSWKCGERLGCCKKNISKHRIHTMSNRPLQASYIKYGVKGN